MRALGRRLFVASGLVVAAVSCEDEVAPPRAQWVVTLSTDAPVPALGDRVLVEIYGRDGTICNGCTRLLGAASPGDWPLSFGIEAETGATMIRARLFRGELAGEGGTPRGTALVDALVTLAPEPEGVEEIGFALRAGCFGVPADPALRTSCDVETGAPSPVLAATAMEPLVTGSWPPALAVPCAGSPPPGMVCVAGGLFLLGDADPPRAADALTSTLPERLVQIPPFFMDAHELTVGEFFTLKAVRPTLMPPFRSMPGEFAECTYDPEGSRPDAPVNCISRGQAVRLCETQGKRLPTEAEWEYAASNGSRETPYPWGTDEPDCDRVVAARADLTSLCSGGIGGSHPPGPADGGSALDVTASGVMNLGGNVSEWVADSFESYGTGCWSGIDLLVGPLCVESTSLLAVRGGDYRSPPASARSVQRAHIENVQSPTIGVRCVASAR